MWFGSGIFYSLNLGFGPEQGVCPGLVGVFTGSFKLRRCSALSYSKRSSSCPVRDALPAPSLLNRLRKSPSSISAVRTGAHRHAGVRGSALTVRGGMDASAPSRRTAGVCWPGESEAEGMRRRMIPVSFDLIHPPAAFTQGGTVVCRLAV